MSNTTPPLLPPISTCTDHVDRDNRVTDDRPVMCPFTVVVDTREQAPWQFAGIRCDSDKKYRPIVVMTERAGLSTGDYSIVGCEKQITIERKSMADAFSTFTVDRERFIRELERMREYAASHVMIEGDWNQLIDGPLQPDKSDRQSLVIGKTCYRSIVAWSMDFPRTHFWMMPGRQIAERHAFRILERFWKVNVKEAGRGVAKVHSTDI